MPVVIHSFSATLSRALKAARRDKGLSQQTLSQRLGLPQSHLSKIESGKVNVSLETFVEIAHHLELEIMLVPRQKIIAVKNLISTLDRGKAQPAYKLDEDEDDDE